MSHSLIDTVIHGHRALPGGMRVEVNIYALYCSTDPWAVRLCFLDEISQTPVWWVFSRSLLVDGLGAASGVGDITVQPGGPDSLLIRLDNGVERAMIEASRRDVRRFIQETCRAIPLGKEHEWSNQGESLEAWLQRINESGTR